MRLSFQEIAAELNAMGQSPSVLADAHVPPLAARVDRGPAWLAGVAEFAMVFRNAFEALTGQPETLNGSWWDRWDRRDLPQRNAALALHQEVLALWKSQGWVNVDIFVDRVGASQRNTAYVDVNEAKIALNIRPGGHLPALDSQERLVDSPFRSWLILAHEAAHVHFKQIKAPFSPSLRDPDNPDDGQDLKRVNDQLFSPWADLKFRDAMDEAFADTYGAMLALRSIQFSPSASEQLLDWIETRERERQAIEKPSKEGQATDVALWKNGQLPKYGLTGPALKRMWLERKTWQDLSGEQMRQRALEIISDTWIQEARARLRQQSPVAAWLPSTVSQESLAYGVKAKAAALETAVQRWPGSEVLDSQWALEVAAIRTARSDGASVGPPPIPSPAIVRSLAQVLQAPAPSVPPVPAVRSARPFRPSV